MKFLLLFENNSVTALELSYYNAFRRLGHEVVKYSFRDAVQRYLPLKYVPAAIQNYIIGKFESDGTLKRVNVDFTKFVLRQNPDVVVSFTNIPLNPSTIVYLRSLGMKVILIYPDAIINMQPRNSAAIPCYDAVFSYSLKGVAAFEMLGARNVYWCPLAADDEQHKIQPPAPGKVFDYDISFIGGHRPEREEVLSFIAKNFPGQKIKIIGNWKECKDKKLFPYIEQKELTGMAYASFLNRSMVNLNIIDASNYPAANMRFFEIPVAGGFQLSSSCPEMENLFLDNVHLLYYKDPDDVGTQIENCLSTPDRLHEIRRNAHENILTEHRYLDRATSIISKLNFGQ